MSDAFKPKTMKRKNLKGLALSAPPPPKGPSGGDAQVPGGLGNDYAGREDTLEIGVEFKLDLRSEDLIVLKELGAGNGGTVSKVMHAATKVVMAKKVQLKHTQGVEDGGLHCTTDHTRRSQARSAEAHRARAPDHARVQFTLYRVVLRGLHE